MTERLLPERLADRLRDLERRLDDLETATPLSSAAIGRGGLKVKDGGSIEIVDDDGDVALTLAAEGLTLVGLLEVLGQFDFTDAEGFRRVRIRPVAEGAEGNISYRSGPDATEGGEVVVGTIFVEDDVSHGLMVQTEDGDDLLRVWSGGVNEQVVLRDGTNIVVQASPDDDHFLNLYDEDGNLRGSVGQVFSGGSPVGYGILLQEADGTDVAVMRPGRFRVDTVDGGGEVTLGAADSGGAGFRVLRVPN